MGTRTHHKLRLRAVNRSVAAKILEESGLELWDYSNHSGFVNETQLFRDRSHLNDDGARLFSEILAERIEETLGSNTL